MFYKSIVSAVLLRLILSACILVSHSALAEPPKVHKSSTGLQYMTGGIGSDHVEEMQPYAKKFTLNLLFSEGIVGRAVTDVNVDIYNEQGAQVFRVVGAKPLLYVNLPVGIYTILANNNGQKLRHKLAIADSANKKVILNWKDLGENQPVEEDSLIRE